MKRKLALICSTILLVLTLVLYLCSCEKHLPGSIPFDYKLDNLQQLKICLGPFVKLPMNSNTATNIYAKSYAAGMKYKVEYDPYIQWAEWEDVIDGVEISVELRDSAVSPIVVNKETFEPFIDGQEFMFFDGHYYHYRNYIYKELINGEMYYEPSVVLTEIKVKGEYSKNHASILYKYMQTFV